MLPWILSPIILGGILLIGSLILMIRTTIKDGGFSKVATVDLFLVLTSLGWIALGIYAYIIVQAQLAL